MPKQKILLELFGGQNSDVAAIDLPEGLSPSCQDVAFLPGSVFTRPALNRLYTASGNSFPINYVKTFLRENGDPITLFITGVDGTGIIGTLWMEDVLNSPGTVTAVAEVPLGCMAKSTTTDNAEYIAFTDGTQGTGAPCWFDGTNFQRVSQDGPGAAPTIADYNPTINIAASPSGLQQTTTASFSWVGTNGTVIISCTVPAGVNSGDTVKITGTSGAFDNTWTISNVGSSGFTIYVSNYTGTGSGGTATFALTDVVISTTGLTIPNGAQATIAGAGVASYDGTWTIRNVISSTHFQVYLPTFSLANSGNGTVAITGAALLGGITAGVHNFVCMFQLQSGYITKPSPIGSWTAAGGLQAIVSNIPLGPPNVVARIIAMTQASGSKYRYIPATVTVTGNTGSTPTVIQSTVIPDNTTTSVYLDFSDASLANGLGIDISGNNLFALDQLGLPIAAYQYANRTVWVGDTNQVQNFRNMSFDGGALSLTAPITQPLWWNVTTSGGKIVTGDNGLQWQWQITGDGTGSSKGELQQTAYLDNAGAPILLPNTQYSIKVWLEASALNLAGSFVAALNSVSTSLTIFASVAVNQVKTEGAFFTFAFASATPSSIPSDLTLIIHAVSMPNGATLNVDELKVIYTNQPYLGNELVVSYVNSPESFDGITGFIETPYPEQPILGCFTLRDQLYIVKSNSLFLTYDNGTTEPSGWTIQEVSKSIGAMSFRAFDDGEDWQIIGDHSGAFMFAGGQPLKISQEVQALWDRINPAAFNTVWIKNDRTLRRVYFGLPLDSATSPNVVLVMDYRELKSAQDVTYADPVHVSYSGKVLSTDLTRKWTTWNIKANSGEVIYRQNGVQEMVFGGASGTGLSTGGFNQLYYLNSSKYTDDDYGQISSFYTTYFFMPKEVQQQMQTMGLNIFSYIRMLVAGLGDLQMTYFGNSLSNAWPQPPVLPLVSNPTQDFELQMNVVTERMAIKFAAIPATGTDAWMDLSKIVLEMSKASIGKRGSS